ncbi:MAG: hypothetical protein ACI9VS_002310 [Candidatus Binatia bacterium]
MAEVTICPDVDLRAISRRHFLTDEIPEKRINAV